MPMIIHINLLLEACEYTYRFCSAKDWSKKRNNPVSDMFVVTVCVSGGNELEIRGSNMLNIQKPQFVVYVNDENRTAVWLLMMIGY